MRSTNALLLVSLLLFAVGCAPQPPRQLEAGGFHHWQPAVRRLPLFACYQTVIVRPGHLEYWNGLSTATEDDTDALAVWRGTDLAQLEEGPIRVLRTASIHDVMDPEDPEKLWPKPEFQRMSVTAVDGLGHVALVCVTPFYQPGKVGLEPALALIPELKEDGGRYLGKLTGEPATIAKTKRVWSDGGSIFCLADGTWRIYLNGYGPTLAILEADRLEGLWRFRRDEDGEIREFAGVYNQGIAPRKGSCFPTVLRVSENEWHLWLSDRWPPKEIWHLWSRDGLSWELYGKQPELTRAAFGDREFKCIRCHYDPARDEIVGLVSVWTDLMGEDDWYMLHEVRMPAGPPASGEEQ